MFVVLTAVTSVSEVIVISLKLILELQTQLRFSFSAAQISTTRFLNRWQG